MKKSLKIEPESLKFMVPWNIMPGDLSKLSTVTTCNCNTLHPFHLRKKVTVTTSLANASRMAFASSPLFKKKIDVCLPFLIEFIISTIIYLITCIKHSLNLISSYILSNTSIFYDGPKDFGTRKPYFYTLKWHFFRHRFILLMTIILVKYSTIGYCSSSAATAYSSNTVNTKNNNNNIRIKSSSSQHNYVSPYRSNNNPVTEFRSIVLPYNQLPTTPTRIKKALDYSPRDQNNNNVQNISEENKIIISKVSPSIRTFNEISLLANITDTFDNTNASQGLCPNCVRRDVAKKFREEFAKEMILSKLGLISPPKINRTLPGLPSLNSIISRIEGKNMQNDADDILARTLTGNGGAYYDTQDSLARIIPKKLMLFAKNGNPKRELKYVSNNNNNHQQRTQRTLKNPKDSNKIKYAMYFDFDKTAYDNIIDEATLWFYVQEDSLQRDRCRGVHMPKFHVFQRRADISKNGTVTFLESRLIGGKDIHTNNNWIYFDVKGLVQSWIESPLSNFGIMVIAKNCLGNDIIVIHPTSSREEPYRPILELSLTPKPQPWRKRREINFQCTEDAPEERCCRYPLVINFDDFGWDFIVAPKRAAINYCFGECPMTFLDQSAHTYLYRLATSLNACCSPSKVSAMSLLYFKEDNSIMYGVVGGLVVERCSCS